MTIQKPPLDLKIQENGKTTNKWREFFTKLVKELNIERGQGPSALPSYTVATVPDATLYQGASIYVSDETGGAVIAFSDGTNWRRVTDRAIIS